MQILFISNLAALDHLVFPLIQSTQDFLFYQTSKSVLLHNKQDLKHTTLDLTTPGEVS